jgi:hypothetical protein
MDLQSLPNVAVVVGVVGHQSLISSHNVAALNDLSIEFPGVNGKNSTKRSSGVGTD